MSYNKKIIRYFLIFLIIILAGIYIWQGIYLPKNKSSKKEIIFTIKKGEGGREIATNLENVGLVKVGTLFRVYNIFKGTSGKLQAGEYLLSSSMAIPEITYKFISGDVIKIAITFPEGFTIDEIEGRLFEKGFIEKSKIKNQKSKIFKQEFKFLESVPDEANLEGFLFPDTYQFINKISAEEIIKIMLENFDNKMKKEMKEEVDRQGKTIFEIITMASMIEKEVKALEDKKIVSGILWKRLENNIPLQVDATISYITGKKGIDISIEETKIDSPYNTYKYRGLPLGPISNPGLESIIAAIYPESSDYWYYLSTPEGETIFSKTLEEHNIAKEKYLK